MTNNINIATSDRAVITQNRIELTITDCEFLSNTIRRE